MQLLYQRVESADLSEGVAPFDPLTNKPPHYFKMASVTLAIYFQKCNLKSV